MKFTSAIFLLLILVQFAYTSKSKQVLELIQNSEEGKEILDKIFLQTSLTGKKLDAKTVNAILNNIKSSTQGINKERTSLQAKGVKTCKSEITSMSNIFHDLTGRALTAHRHTEQAKNRQSRREIFLSRANEELEHYQTIRGFIRDNHKIWKKFHTGVKASQNNVIDWLTRANEHVRDLGKSAFVELPGTYKSNLVQITADFEQLEDNLNGLKPVISNLLQLLNTNNVSKSDFRQKIHSIIRHLIEAIGDFKRQQEEENEFRESLYTSMETLLTDAVTNADKVAKGLKKLTKEAEKKIKLLKDNASWSNQLAKEAKTVVDQRADECRLFSTFNARQEIHHAKKLSAITNIQDILSDRFGALSKLIEEKYEIKDL